jgi:DNA-binding CsgD family transcriptional regulator
MNDAPALPAFGWNRNFPKKRLISGDKPRHPAQSCRYGRFEVFLCNSGEPVDQRTYNCLLDDIYETATNPSLWVTVMERIADAVGGNNAWLSQISVADGNGTGVIARIDPVMPQRYIDYYAGLNPFANRPRPAEYISRWKPRVSTDEDAMPKKALVATEFYNDFMRPQDVHNVLMIDLAVHGLDVSTVNIHRAEPRGQFDGADLEFAQSLHPHLVRAFRLGDIFSKMKGLIGDSAAALEETTHGIFILDSQCHIRHVNRAGENILGRRTGLGVVAGKLIATPPDSARKLLALIGAAASPDPDTRRGGSMALASARFGEQFSITVAPLRAERLPVFVYGPSVLVTVTDPHAELTISDRRLQDLFAFTAAEVRIARALLEGATLRETAKRFGTSVNTVRSQLARIFEKTRTTSQAELSRLLTRLATSNIQ